MPISSVWRPRRSSPIGYRPYNAPAAADRFVPERMTQDMTDALLDRIHTRQAQIGVIGLGYVGLPLAVEFARAGFHVTGFDVDQSKVSTINAGRSYIPDVAQDDLAAVVKSAHFR